MPPRLPGPSGLMTFSLCIRPATKAPTQSLQPLVQKANLSQKEKEKVRERNRRMRADPYKFAQVEQRVAANTKKQQEVKQAKETAWGDPVHGITTPFVESFDSGGQAVLSTPPTDEDGNPLEQPHELPNSPHLLNHLLTKQELDGALSHSYLLNKPLQSTTRDKIDPVEEEDQNRTFDQNHSNAIEALQRITTLSSGSAKDRKHANIRRCVETFGRHSTDQTLPRPAPPLARGVEDKPKPVRGGPDTGSSEVQIAILTAKIRALALELEGPKGYRDKNNKRSLRSLCHRRQRLLRYMERKERGSERWVHLIETLGLSPATWKEQISL